MAALAPAVAAIRTAVRRVMPLAGTSGAKILVACSGGPDSLALAAATAFVAPRFGQQAGLVTVDHQMQLDSAQQATAVADWARSEGFQPVVVETVTVDPRRGGPEAAARAARYLALARAARAHGAGLVLLGHTRDDQAETVLLALLRGAGLHGLAGMPQRRVLHGVSFVRPLLDVSRRQTSAACAALGLQPWPDPQNADPTFARTRARMVLRTLVESLGPAVVPNLARTARLAAADAAVLDDLAASALAAARDADDSLRVPVLVELAAAVRTRVLHGWARSLGVPGSDLSHRHIDTLDALVVGWRGQGAVHLPGGITVARRRHRLVIGSSDAGGPDARSGEPPGAGPPGPDPIPAEPILAEPILAEPNPG